MDNPAALYNNFKDEFVFNNEKDIEDQVNDGKVSSVRFEYCFNLLYSLYSLPNIIIPLLGGILTDKFGTRPMIIILTILIFLSSLVFAIGFQIRSLNLMLLGRVIFGIGGES